MAAFPPPTLRLDLDSPLQHLISACPGFIAPHRSHHFPDREAILRWFQTLPPTPYETLLAQLEELTRKVHRHRGSVNGLEDFGRHWPTPFDCLNDLIGWRRELSAALVLVDHPPFFSPSWLTEPVVGLSAGIAAERAFDRLPILADALEEAGCDNRCMLDHLRADDDHAHHCWVVDVLRVGGGDEI